MTVGRGRVSNNVRRLREAAAMTQAELGERVGATRQTIIAIEAEKYAPSHGPTLTVTADFSGAEATALGVDLDETEGTDRYNTTETADGGNTDGDNPGLGRVTTSVTGGLVNLFAALGGEYGSDGAGTTSGSFGFTGFPPGGELATTLSATNGGAITLVRTSGTLLTGEDTDGHTVFTIAIVDVGGGVYQLQTTLYEALNHGDNENPDLFDETVELLLGH